jgi:hypothetical protein
MLSPLRIPSGERVARRPASRPAVPPLARASQPSEFRPLLDPEVMRAIDPERLRLMLKQMKKEKKRVERNGRH